jgi:phytoene dehydrogenase-like protein
MPGSVIVLGAGHNGLVAATYLARAGAEVLVLERRDFVGGACITEELFPGFRVSSCSYICHLLQRKVIDDLQLRRHGLAIHPVDPYRFQPFPGGNYLLRWHHAADSEAEIARLAPGDVAGYRRYRAFMDRAAGILYRYFLTDPPTMAEVSAQVRGSADEAVWERMLTGNMRDLVEEHFESPEVRAAFIDAEDAQDPRAPGSIMSMAYIHTDKFTEPQNLGIPHGGMGGITQAMARAAESLGVEIRTSSPVDRILVRDGRAVGVRLEDGEVIESDVVLSNGDPKRTFLSMIDERQIDTDLVSHVRRLKTNVSYLKFHAALDALPDFTGYLGDRYNEGFLVQVRICPSVDYFQQSADSARAGRPSSTPVMHIQIPSVLDRSLAPDGKHVMSIWVLYAPVRPKQGTWDELREETGEHLIDVIEEYAPNFRKSVRDWELFTPQDLEERVGLTDGNIRHLDITAAQMLGNRPGGPFSGYSTPVDSLYLCGAGAHPGGEVTGVPGHNAAHTVLRDWEMAQ